jgi:hypothetical protein
MEGDKPRVDTPETLKLSAGGAVYTAADCSRGVFSNPLRIGSRASENRLSFAVLRLFS